jgi:queuine tRNA-ribosyltransferase
VHRSPNGFSSIRHCASGELMHSRTPPLTEAHHLYIEQSGLKDRLRIAGEHRSEPLVIWDVGLGGAANAMSAITCYEKLDPPPDRPLHILSFENDLDPLRLALSHHHEFSYLHHGGPVTLLQKGFWQSKKFPGLTWQLLHGDFSQTIHSAPQPPDLIFYDFFSPRSVSAPWGLGAFETLRTACKNRPVEIFTYSCSTAVRAAMLAAGFYVAHGRPCGEKSETTIALTPEAVPHTAYRLLDHAWLSRWHRSGARLPLDLTPDALPGFEARITGHPQFR